MINKNKNKIFDLYLELFCGKTFFIHKLNDPKLKEIEKPKNSNFNNSLVTGIFKFFISKFILNPKKQHQKFLRKYMENSNLVRGFKWK